AYIVDGVALGGAHGAAGEIGHTIIRPGGPPCGCGAHGCLEAVSSAAAIARRYAAESGAAPARRSTVDDQATGGGDGPGAGGAGGREVVAGAAEGDAVARRVWQDSVEALADGLLTGVALFDPAVVVVGGGLAEAGDALLDPLRAALRERLTFH